MSVNKLDKKILTKFWSTDFNHFFVKINEIISQLSTSAFPMYAANLSQAETAAPVATVQNNTTGATITWSRDSEGVYLGTPSSNIFPTASKVSCLISGSTSQGLTVNEIKIANLGQGNVIYINCIDPVSVTPVDSSLLSNSIQIIIYP